MIDLNFTHNVAATPPTLAALFSFVTAMLVLHRERLSGVGWVHFFLSMALGLWQTGAAMEMLSADSATANIAARLSTIFVFATVALHVHMGAIVANRVARSYATVAAVWGSAVVLTCLTFFSDWIIAGAQRYSWGWYAEAGRYGAIFPAHVAISMSLCMFGYWRWRKNLPRESGSEHRIRLLIMSLAIGSLCLWDFLPVFGVDVYPISAVVVIIIDSIGLYAVWRYRLVEFTASFAAPQLLNTMSDGVVVLDDAGYVRLVNQAAADMMDTDTVTMLNAPATPSILKLLLGVEGFVQLPQAGYVSRQQEYLSENGARRHIAVSLSVITDGRGDPSAVVATLRDITSGIEAQEQIHRLAYHDPLTNLPNRLALRERFSHVIAAAERAGSVAAVLFLDLDRFKQINDSLGHEAGDYLLKAISQRLTEGVRQGDALLRNSVPEGESTVARLGGDEFLLLMAPLERADVAAAVAQRILEAVRAPVILPSGDEVFTGTSIGISLFPLDGNDAETLMKKADIAMYHAKQGGRNRYRFFDEAMNSAINERLAMETSLRRALRADKLLLRYDPIVNIRSGIVEAFDAQLHWQRSSGEMLSEANFHTTAVESGMLVQITEWAVQTACFQLRAWDASGVQAWRIALACDALVLERGALPQVVKNSLEESAIDASRLILHLRFTRPITDDVRFRANLTAIAALGVKLGLDDARAGRVRLADLTTLPTRELRINHALMSGLGTAANSRAVTRALVNLAHGLNYRINVSGIAHEDDYLYLREIGCDLGQGPYFSTAVEAEDVADVLRALAHRAAKQQLVSVKPEAGVPQSVRLM